MSPNYLLPVLAALLVCSTAFADEPEKPTRKSESEAASVVLYLCRVVI